SPSVQASRRGDPITIDGRLDEASWSTAQAASNFRQAQPHPGDPATQRTEVRILFDEEALYIGARMFDDQGAPGVRSQLVRRDQSGSNSDQLQLIFDTFHNHLGRTIFTVNPSGVKQDAGQATEFADPSWDPVWQAKTQVDSLGWTAELRIPFSELRVGADLKYLLTSNLTLDATINPDFGQVEVDPAVVNLSAFETFFPERRPFFIEGSGTFGFGGFSCFFCSNVSSLSLFYSRRIGR